MIMISSRIKDSSDALDAVSVQNDQVDHIQDTKSNRNQEIPNCSNDEDGGNSNVWEK